MISPKKPEYSAFFFSSFRLSSLGVIAAIRSYCRRFDFTDVLGDALQAHKASKISRFNCVL